MSTFWSILGQLYVHFLLILGQFLGQFYVNFRLTFWLILGQFKINFWSIQGQFLVNFRSLFVQFLFNFFTLPSILCGKGRILRCLLICKDVKANDFLHLTLQQSILDIKSSWNRRHNEWRLWIVGKCSEI